LLARLRHNPAASARATTANAETVQEEAIRAAAKTVT
jgi:hypothetical protein